MKKRRSTEQIVGLLRQADVDLGKGSTVPDVCRRLGISQQTYYRWRTKFGEEVLWRAWTADGLQRLGVSCQHTHDDGAARRYRQPPYLNGEYSVATRNSDTTPFFSAVKEPRFSSDCFFASTHSGSFLNAAKLSLALSMLLWPSR